VGTIAQTHLGSLVALVVIGAGVLHACWNAIAKHVEDRLIAFALIGVVLTAGGGATLALTGLPSRACLAFAIVSTVLRLVYDAALMNCYRLGSFNQVYPIARGTSPLVVALGAYLFVGERLAGLELCGVTILAGGLMSLALSSGRIARADLPAVGAAILTGLTIASYSLVDGIGVRHAHNPLAYAALLFVLEGPVFPVVALVRRPPAAWATPRVLGTGLTAGALTFLAYGAVLWAQSRAPLAEVAALRETSVITAALIGTFVLRERFGARRVASAVLVAAGILLISR